MRLATDDDAPALARLAALDSTRVPTGPMLLALVDGELRAAVPLAGGRAVADPWHPTADLVGLLEMRAARLRDGETSVRTPRQVRWRRLRALGRAAT